MKLCIADPPYFGRASVWYGNKMTKSQLGKNQGGSANISGPKPADYHPEAQEWDKIEKHQEMVSMLIDRYDGWAIAMAHDNLRDYLPLIPRSVPIHVGIWNKPQNMPSGARVMNTYEPVVFHVPEGRRASKGQTIFPKDCVTISRINNGFPGAKPIAWTQWVLDLLGYDSETDQVDDLFHGSGAVTKALQQPVLI
jgi:hypothetical protein